MWSIITVVPYPAINVMVDTYPSKTLLTGNVALALISIPGLSKVVFKRGFHCGPNDLITFPFTGQSNFPL